MARTISTTSRPGRRRRSKTGTFRRHRVGFLGLRQCPGCKRCGYDGWIKTGEKKKGRRPGRSKRSTAGRIGTYAGGCAVFYGACSSYLGTIGQVLAVVAIVVFTVLKVLAILTKAVAR